MRETLDWMLLRLNSFFRYDDWIVEGELKTVHTLAEEKNCIDYVCAF